MLLTAPPFNKRVLVIDADPQGTLTKFFQPSPADWEQEYQAFSAKGASDVQKAQQPSEVSAAGKTRQPAKRKASESHSLSEDVYCPETDPMKPIWFKDNET